MPIPPLSSLLPPPFLVGVDVGSRRIKVVEAHARSRFRVQVKGFGAADTPPGAYENGHVHDPVALGHAIRDAVRQAGIRSRSASIAVGPQVSFVRKLDFPVMPEAELRSVIQLQPDRYLPIAAGEEPQFDLFILPHDPGAEQMPVILAVAPRSVVVGLMKACRVAGLKPVLVDMEPLALFRAVIAVRKETPGGTFAVVDLGDYHVKLSLFEGELPVVSRVLSVQPPSQAEVGTAAAADWTDDLFLDIRRSLEYGLSQTSRPLGALYLTGARGGDEYLALSLAGYLRGFMSHRLAHDFVTQPLQHAFLGLPGSHMLALGLSLRQELFNDSNQPVDQA